MRTCQKVCFLIFGLICFVEKISVAKVVKGTLSSSMAFLYTVKIGTIFTLSIRTPQLFTILVLNFEQVEFTT